MDAAAKVVRAGCLRGIVVGGAGLCVDDVDTAVSTANILNEIGPICRRDMTL